MDNNIDKNQTLFCNKLYNIKINDLLDQILKRLSNFNKICGYCPKNITLNVESYMKIISERPDLILKKIDGEYILCMKILIEGTSYVS